MSDNRHKIRQLAENVQKDPDDSFSKFALALELLKNNQVEKALALFESIYHRNPGYLGVYYHLGKLYQSLEEFGSADKIFREGIDIATNQGETRTLDELKEALESLKADLI